MTKERQSFSAMCVKGFLLAHRLSATLAPHRPTAHANGPHGSMKQPHTSCSLTSFDMLTFDPLALHSSPLPPSLYCPPLFLLLVSLLQDITFQSYFFHNLISMATAPSCSDGKNIDVNRKKSGNLSRSRLYANRWVEIGPETTTKTSSHKITGIWFKRKQEIKKASEVDKG